MHIMCIPEKKGSCLGNIFLNIRILIHDCFVNWLFIQYVSENEERATLIHFCKFRNI